MQRALSLYSTTIGKKVAMALSGVILSGFTVAHMLGNLQIFKGAETFNAYAAKLQGDLLPITWTVRILLLASVSIHLISALSLFNRNRHARPSPYAKKRDLATDYAAKTMYWTGPMLLAFIVFHLAHMTFARTFGIYEWSETGPYDNLVHGFQHLAIVIPYVIGNVCLGMHLWHGVFSAFQSVGANHPKYNQLRRDLSIGLAALVTLGNLSMPIAVQLGYVLPTDAVIQGGSAPLDGGAIAPLLH